MRVVLLLLPAALGALVLAAHFLRRGDAAPMLLCLGIVALLFVRRPWSARAIQAAMLLGAVEWLRTLAAFVTERRAAGEPWTRLALILGAVALLSLGAALAFESATLRRRFGRGAAGARAPGAP
jgi:hypothetical protein